MIRFRPPRIALACLPLATVVDAAKVAIRRQRKRCDS
jgi:hypothetical protein